MPATLTHDDIALRLNYIEDCAARPPGADNPGRRSLAIARGLDLDCRIVEYETEWRAMRNACAKYADLRTWEAVDALRRKHAVARLREMRSPQDTAARFRALLTAR